MEITISEKDSIPTLCLNMICKNESKIITRLLESVSSIIDSYCICDTGSTDDTVSIITTFFENKGIPGKIVSEPFINFEHNRNYALKAASGMSDYLLLMDADMVLSIKNFEKKRLLEGDVFSLLQGNDNFHYLNVRIIRNKDGFSYKSVTHEYVDQPPNSINVKLSKDELFIIDIGDGCSKTDKFERDIRLLKEDLEKNPNKDRTLFYLANSYHDVGQYEEAIKYYKRRIEVGGWIEEVWYSYYRIGNCYYQMDDHDKAVSAWLDGFDKYPDRLENMFRIINHYRNVGKQKVGYWFLNYLMTSTLPLHYANVIDRTNFLFLENDVYTYKFDYEKVILAYYIGIKNVNNEIIRIFNYCMDDGIIQSCLMNMKFYKFILKPTKVMDVSESRNGVLVNGKGYDFKSSSMSLIKNDKTSVDVAYMANKRYVNYVMVNNYQDYQYDQFILTINKYIEYDSEFNVINEKILDNIQHDGRRYGGVEDVRLFRDSDGKKIFIGTGFHEDNSIGIVYGDYDKVTNFGSSYKYLKPKEIKQKFINSDCEKNWVYMNYKGSTHVVYNWYPLRICKIQDDGESKSELVVVEEKNMPVFFRHVRGSSCGFNYNNEIWFVCHIVSYESPRHYYHILVTFDTDMNITNYSAPFKFSEECIEYCIGLIVEDERLIMTYSKYDNSTSIATYDKKYIEGLFKLYVDVDVPITE